MATLHERRIKAPGLSLAFAVTGLALMGTAHAAAPCITQATAPPVITETITCAQAAISRFFLASPAMKSMAASQQAEVTSHPLRYAFAYMGADAVNRLQQGFTDPAVKQIDYKASLSTGTGAPHKMFEIRMNRALARKTDWASLEPNQLFKLAPSHLSHWLQAGLKAEDAKGEPAGLPPTNKAPAATNPPAPAGPSPSATDANTGK